MPITLDEVERIASLAELDLSPAEAPELASEMTALVDFVEEMGEADGESRPENAFESAHATPERPDVPAPGVDRDTVLANAPEHRRGHVALPPLRRPADAETDPPPEPRETG